MTTFSRRNTKARKLTAYDVQVIRRRYGEGITQGELAREYVMSVGQIGRIVRGESWPGLPEETGLPSAREQDEMLKRLLEVQPVVAPSVHLPVSPLEGGDAPSETQGAGTAALVSEAAKLGEAK